MAMKTKHTKGEWELTSVGYTFDIFPTDDKREERICRIEPMYDMATINAKTDKFCHIEAEANAKLIAQSPTMYQFLTEYIDAMKDKTKLTIHEKALLISAEEIINSI